MTGLLSVFTDIAGLLLCSQDDLEEEDIIETNGSPLSEKSFLETSVCISGGVPFFQVTAVFSVEQENYKVVTIYNFVGTNQS